MATIIPNSFTSYDLTEEEVIQGSIYNSLQLQVLNNHLATAAEEKIALDYDPQNKENFLQQEAALKSKIGILKYLIDASEASLDTLKLQNQPANGDI